MVEPDRLEELLTRQHLTVIRDQLAILQEEASCALITRLFQAEREEAPRDTRCIQMGMRLARFLRVRTLEGVAFDVQPSIDPSQVRDLATGSWIGRSQER